MNSAMNKRSFLLSLRKLIPNLEFYNSWSYPVYESFPFENRFRFGIPKTFQGRDKEGCFQIIYDFIKILFEASDFFKLILSKIKSLSVQSKWPRLSRQCEFSLSIGKENLFSKRELNVLCEFAYLQNNPSIGAERVLLFWKKVVKKVIEHQELFEELFSFLHLKDPERAKIVEIIFYEGKKVEIIKTERWMQTFIPVSRVFNKQHLKEALTRLAKCF